MNERATEQRHDSAGCGCGCDRRDFLTAMGAAAGAITFTSLRADAAEPAADEAKPRKRTGATVRAVFLYPPSSTFANNPNGWWSWPGNDFDAEGRQKQYTAALREIEKKHGMKIVADEKPVANRADAERLAAELKAEKPDGLLLVMFYNRILGEADFLLKVADELGIPVVFFIGLGVKHGPVAGYRRPGVYFIQSLDNLEAIEYGLRMINARKLMAQSKLLSITEAPEPREGVEAFLGVTVRVIPFAQYAALFEKVTIDAAARELIKGWTGGAKEVRAVTGEALENAARAHLALLKLLEQEQADGLTMNCLRRGMLKPCVSFATLNSRLVPAACENDLPAAYTQLLGQLLTGRPGFQHNPCYETERNHYYGSHCTCPMKLEGPDGPEAEYLLRRFAHTNEGSCAIQVFFKPGDPATMVRYHPGKPPALDVYAARVVQSHPMPPAAGCTTNVEIEVTDRPDACMVRGHHNLIFSGDFARKFRLFAQLFKMRLAETGFAGPYV
jgi:hypothetical protein